MCSRTVKYCRITTVRLRYCIYDRRLFSQDPEVVMAPLPISHRPLSIDSRDTSMSNSSRGGASGGAASIGTAGGQSGNGAAASATGASNSQQTLDSSADSASGFSLPMRGCASAGAASAASAAAALGRTAVRSALRPLQPHLHKWVSSSESASHDRFI